MGIRDLVAQQASKAKQFVTGKPSELTEEQRYPEAAHGQLARVESPSGESRASQVAKATKNFINRQSSSTFKNAVGYGQNIPGKKLNKKEKAELKKYQSYKHTQQVGNIPRTRVPGEPQQTNFINRQIDLSYNKGQGYTSNILNEAFRWKQFENKQPKAPGGLPSLRGTFETAVGYKAPNEKKKGKFQKITIVLKRERKPQIT